MKNRKFQPHKEEQNSIPNSVNTNHSEIKYETHKVHTQKPTKLKSEERKICQAYHRAREHLLIAGEGKVKPKI